MKDQGRHLALAVAMAFTAFIGSSPAGVSAQAPSSILISEVHSAGSGNTTYAADWIELTNAGAAAQDITGWRMDDNSNAFANAVALRGITSIPAGRSVVFVENSAVGVLDATVIGNFSTAWFGSATPPAGILIGAYGGSGVGLGTGGDAVNIFDAGGNKITGVSFGTATPTATFDNAAGLGSATLPLPLLSTLSVAGVNGAFLSSNGLETGSPGRRANAPALDLSLYVRTGRFDLPEPTRTTAPANSLLAQEVSAVTYNWDTDTLFVVGDGGTSIVQVSKTGQLIDSMTLAQGSSPQGTDFYDPEGLTYVGGGQFVMVEERDRQAVLLTYAAGTTLTRAGVQTVKLGTFVPNIGIEGMSYDPLTGGFIAVKETEPQGIFQTAINFVTGTATNGSPTTEDSIDLFDPALAGLADFADVFALSNLPSLSGGTQASRLLVLSQESGRIVNIDRSGNISSSLTIVADPGNPLSVAAHQHEGLTMDHDGILYVVSENGGGDFDHPQLWVYEPSAVPNQAPTALALTNQQNTIAEGTSTAVRIKVADVVVTDEGLGTNNLTVTGPDAAFFEADVNGLYIKAGTTLDYETKSSYSISVEVDDPTVGANPDATAGYGLTLIDGVEQPPSAISLVISEVAPWSSGNSPVAADWFEVTNIGAGPVNIAAWKVDDISESFVAAVALSGITSIAPGESVIFIETADLALAKATFLSTWFGTNPPAALQIGSYTGSGIGLSTGGDAVNLYNSIGVLKARVFFGASPAGPVFPTFDNAAGLNNAGISQLSVAGVNGVFVAADNVEIGSPGTTVADTTPPVIVTHADVFVSAVNAAGAIATYVLPAASDNVDLSVVVTCAPVSGTQFPLGPTLVTCAASDAAANAAAPVTFTLHVLDTTPPTVTYTGNAGSYTVNQFVSIQCVATDAASGVASSTCANISGPAWSFAVGPHTYSATATDVSGNVSQPVSTTFTIVVSVSSLQSLVKSFSTKPGVAFALNVTLQAAAYSGNAKVRAVLLRAFNHQVNAQTGKALTAAQAATLIRLVQVLF